MLGSAGSFRRRLLRWYDAHKRDLPWRHCVPGSPRPDPYHVLLSEAMLQQTQVATVIPYFNRFLSALPTLADLAAADEQQVLRLWQGLGYYSRARNLHAAAKQVVLKHRAELPQTVDGLMELPGVGRYTAGAIASIAFDVPAPILDGNVIRVLSRLDGIRWDPREKKTQDHLWQRAEQVLPRKRAGDFNSALMELGATVCTPRAPKCLLCPVRDHCEAQAAGMQEQIPPPARAKPRPLEERWTFCIRNGDQWLIERRPATGRWAGMWQFITFERSGDGAPENSLLEQRLAMRVGTFLPIGIVSHGLTHRRYQFEVFLCESDGNPPIGMAAGRAWTTLAGLSDYPLPRPHLRIAELLARMG